VGETRARYLTLFLGPLVAVALLATWSPALGAGSREEALVTLGEAETFLKTEQFDRARQLLEKAHAHFSEVGDRVSDLKALRLLGDAFAKLARAREAVSAREQAVRLAKELRNTREVYELLGILAGNYQRLNDSDASIRASKERLALLESQPTYIRNESGQVYIPHRPLVDLAWAYYHRGEYQEALGYAKRAVGLKRYFTYTPPRGISAEASNISGLIHLEIGNYLDALDSLQDALQFWKENDDKRGMAVAYENLGLCYQRVGRHRAEGEHNPESPASVRAFDPARLSFERARALYSEVGNKAGEARVARLLSRADALATSDSTSQAILAKEQALQRARRSGDVSTECQILIALANDRLSIGDIEGAARYSKERLSLIESHPSYIYTGKGDQYYVPHGALKDLAWAYYRRGDYREALPYAKRALTLPARWQPLRTTMAEVKNIYGLINLELGKYPEALDALQEALRLWTKDNNKRGMAAGHLNLAFLHRAMGELQKAAELLDRALPLYRESGHPHYPLALYHAGSIRLELGRPADAETFFREQLRISDDPSGVMHRIRALIMLSRVAERRGETKTALPHLTSALELARRTGFENLRADIHDRIGRIYLGTRDFQEASDHIARAYEIRSGLRAGINASLESLTRLAMAQGDLASARKHLDKYEKRVSHQALTGSTWSFWTLKGSFHEAEKKRDLAYDALENAIGQIEAFRAQLRVDEFRAGFVEDKQEAYEALIRVAADLGRHSNAFDGIERTKARSFLDLLAQRHLRTPLAETGEIPEKYEELDQRERILEAELRTLESGQSAVGNPEEQLRRKVEELRSVTTERDALTRELSKSNARVLDLAARPSDITELQRRVPADSILLSYYVRSNTAVVGVLDRDRVHVVNVRTVSIEEVLAFARLLADPQSTGWEASARRLYDHLVAPILNEIEGKKRLIIVPHGPLHYLPFHALLMPGSRFLGDVWAVSYLPSASVLRYLPAVPAERERTVLAVANPSVPGLPALRGAEAEVRGIAQLFPTQVLAREKAQKTKVIEESPRHRILHFASHGELDVRRPLQSSLRLAPSDGDDGRLTVDEIFNLSLQAEIVVLSACETGLGATFGGEAISPGDELVGLSRAFLFAGAQSLIVTLWPVDDAATARLMVEFYRHIQTMPKAEALKRAQDELRGAARGRSEGGFAHPFFWAAFTLIGDGQ